MSKDEIIETVIRTNQRTADYLENLNHTLKKLNDNGVIHQQLLRVNTTAINKIAIENQASLKMIRKIIYLIIIALIVLAGAEKVLEIIPHL